MKKIKVLVEFAAKEDVKNQLEDFLKQVEQNLPAVEGCIGVELGRGDGPGEYVLWESWQSREAHQTHIRGLEKAGAFEQLGDLLVGPLRSRYFDEF